MHDDVGPRRRDGAFERVGIEHVDDRQMDAGRLKFARDVGLARHADDVVARFQQQRRQPPPDGATRSSEKNPHAHVFRS